MDEELLNDFLIEAGELIDGMDAQVVALEQSPGDRGVLDGIFRTFHTVKGGAGFLGLRPLVTLCHRAEDLLNVVRSGERALDRRGIDLILRSVDELKRMFGEVGSGTKLEPTPAAFLDELDAVTHGADAHLVLPQVVPPPSAPAADPVLERFEAMLRTAPPGEPAAPAPDLMTDEDFDALIDAIQGRPPAAPPSAPAPPAAPARPAAPRAAVADIAPQKPAADERAGPRPTSAVEHTLRVDAGRVDGVMNLVGELVLVRNRLSSLRQRVKDEDLDRTLSTLNLVTSDLQSSVMRLRMQPVNKAFGRFPRVVRDLARQLGKEVSIEMRGEATEIDKGMVELLADPLVHLVRNAIDHGIEMPAEREKAGKPACGRLELSAHQEGSHIFITVSDDGAGLDPALIRRKAVDKGLIDPRAALQLADADAFKLLFAPGFSTRAAVSDISGRGVGLDVVKSQIARVNGTVDISSEKGRGTRIVIRLPLTLAILPSLMVIVGERRVALPLPVIEEIVDLNVADCAVMDGNDVLSLRGEVLPLLDLARWLGPAREGGRGRAFVIVAHTGARRVGLVVDKLIGQEDVVIKSLGARLQGLPGLAGATITGDGGIALILDVGTLYASWHEATAHARREPAACAAEPARALA